MKLETTQTTKQAIEIPVPSFYKDNGISSSLNDMIAILDEKTICQIWESNRRTFVSNSDIDLSKDDIIKAFLTYEPITEQEFLTAYNRALHSLSLTPELSNNL